MYQQCVHNVVQFQMKGFAWNEDKNNWLRQNRGISFNEVVRRLHEDGFLSRIDHPNPAKYPGQEMFVVRIQDYIYLVPFVEETEKYFLKTIMPSRKLTRKYLNRRKPSS